WLERCDHDRVRRAAARAKPALRWNASSPGRPFLLAEFMDQGTPGGDAQLLRAEALGEPGQRRFRLVTVINDETFMLWMEKQQLQALGMAIAQLMENVPPAPDAPSLQEAAISVDDETRNQFRVGRIELAFDE